MTPYYEDSAVRLFHADCRDVLAELPEASIDACVTDAPYELGFMGKQWDRSGIAFDASFWREVGRVLKPGAHLLACGGTRTYHRMGSAIEDASFEIRDCLAWLFGSGFPKSLNLGAGLGTALKPAHEPIVLARKPFKGSVRSNVETHGTGALNIDAVRIRTEEDRSRPPGRIIGATWDLTSRTEDSESHPLGRWPANVCLDEIAAAVLDEQSGELVSGFMAAGQKREGIGYHGGLGDTVRNDTHADSGGASRFYYVAKPSREERDYGTEGLATRQRDDSRDPDAPGANNPRNRGGQQRGNFHPTVKPVELMRWLVRLVTPPGGVVLDPFLGSGTTGMACRYEQRRFIGIEREPDYMAIAERRIRAVVPLFTSVDVGTERDAVDPIDAARGTDQRPRAADLFTDGSI